MITEPLQYLQDGAIAVPPENPQALRVRIDVPAGVYRYYEEGDELPELPLPPPSPNWAKFRLEMLADPGFRRIVAYGETIDQSSLAAEINQNPPNYPTVQALELLWNSIRAVVPSGSAPTVVEVGVWNAIATDANIPFRFSSSGFLEQGTIRLN